MERGMGWHYPPGTPGPRTRAGEAECENGHRFDVHVTTDLGFTTTRPEECPECGTDNIEIVG